MIKTSKKIIICAVLFVFSLTFGVFASFSAQAEENETSSELTVIQGASVRLDGTPAIRFQAKVSENLENEVKAGTKKLGMIIVPEDYTEEYTSGDYYDFYTGEGRKYLLFNYEAEHIADAKDAEDNDIRVISGAIRNVLYNNIDRNFTAIAFEETVSTGAKKYSLLNVNRSVAYVSSAAINDSQDNATLVENVKKAAYKSLGVTFDAGNAEKPYVYNETNYAFSELAAADGANLDFSDAFAPKSQADQWWQNDETNSCNANTSFLDKFDVNYAVTGSEATVDEYGEITFTRPAGVTLTVSIGNLVEKSGEYAVKGTKVNTVTSAAGAAITDDDTLTAALTSELATKESVYEMYSYGSPWVSIWDLVKDFEEKRDEYAEDRLADYLTVRMYMPTGMTWNEVVYGNTVNATSGQQYQTSDTTIVADKWVNYAINLNGMFNYSISSESVPQNIIRTLTGANRVDNVNVTYVSAAEISDSPLITGNAAENKYSIVENIDEAEVSEDDRAAVSAELEDKGRLIKLSNPNAWGLYYIQGLNGNWLTQKAKFTATGAYRFLIVRMYFPEGMTWKTPRLGEASSDNYKSTSGTPITAGKWIDVKFDLNPDLYSKISDSNPWIYFRTNSGMNLVDGKNEVYVSEIRYAKDGELLEVYSGDSRQTHLTSATQSVFAVDETVSAALASEIEAKGFITEVKAVTYPAWPTVYIEFPSLSAKETAYAADNTKYKYLIVRMYMPAGHQWKDFKFGGRYNEVAGNYATESTGVWVNKAFNMSDIIAVTPNKLKGRVRLRTGSGAYHAEVGGTDYNIIYISDVYFSDTLPA